MARGRHAVTDHHHVFLSYSRNDPAAAATLRGQLERCGLSVFKDDERIRAGDLWLDRLQEAVDGCGAFVVLVGRDGVRRWIGAETQAALNRYFGPHDDAERLPIFPILLDDTGPETLPAFLRLFQMTPWNGADPLPERLLADIRERNSRQRGDPVRGLPVRRARRLSSSDQAHLFFGRQKETLDALACFDARPAGPAVRWLEINGNSGSGKSSLMNAGLLPLIDQGWLWPRTGYEHWRRIGPMMPGEHPVEMLAEHLARAFDAEMADVRTTLGGRRRRRCGLAARAASRTTPPSCSPSTSSRSCSPSPMRTSAAASTACSRPRWKTPTARCSSSPPCAPTFSTASPRTCRGWSLCATGWAGPGRWRRSAPTACARSSTARPGSPAST